MIERVTSLRIKGGIFEKETDLSLFSKEKQNPRFSLVYGKNGSGKSTISRGFRKIAGIEKPQIELSEVLDENNAVLTLADEDQKSLYVFNEDFIEDNIRIDGDGLNTIIVMGAIKEVDDKIKKIQPTYDKSVIDVEAQEKIWDKYLDDSNILCPNYYINKMQKCLRGDNSWASRDAKIHGKKINSHVKNNTYLQFIGQHPLKTRDELIVAYDIKMKELTAAKAGSKKIDISVPTLKVFTNKESNIINLLKEKIEKPVLSEREKALFLTLQKDNGNQELYNIKSYFAGPQKTKCPFCFQGVDAKYADDLVQSIEKILSKKVEEHQNKLAKEKLIIFEINFSYFKELSPNKVKDCEEKLEVLNSTIKRVNELIIQKIENVYEPVIEDKFELKKKYDECQDSLLELEKARKKFNFEAVDTIPIIEELTGINSNIAYYDLKDLNEKHKKQLTDKKCEEKKFEDLKQVKKALKKQKDELEQEKKNANIAMNSINDDLAYIFFSRTRLRVEYDDDKYVLYSHERPVEPGNISVGERNAIGLCYFFNRIMENKNEEDVYKRKYLMVIDDPVSSFDMENRIGILSYLKYKLGQYFRGNDDSKFLILTHDMQTFYDVKHSMIELVSSRYRCSEAASSKYVKYLELKNKNIIKIDIGKRNEYTALLGNVFDYAVKIDEQYSVNIGNIMRKVMEAFSTFVYKKGISQLSTDESIVSKLSKKDRAYYENLMYRLVLNTGSHMEEKVKTVDDMNFFDYISEEDKQRTARDVICFLYKLNSLHIKAHLKDKESAVEIIEAWCNL